MSASPITLGTLHEKFVTRLGERLRHLSECLDVLRNPGDERDAARALDDMMRGFHSLAGIGGTFGYAQITDLASIGEVTCETVTLPLSGEDARALAELVDSLRACAASVKPHDARL